MNRRSSRPEENDLAGLQIDILNTKYIVIILFYTVNHKVEAPGVGCPRRRMGHTGFPDDPMAELVHTIGDELEGDELRWGPTPYIRYRVTAEGRRPEFVSASLCRVGKKRASLRVISSLSPSRRCRERRWPIIF